MKSLVTTAAMAIAGLSFSSTTGTAALATYNSGDLLLGFRATGAPGATKDYVLNLGFASQFTVNTPTFTLSLGDVGADLSSLALFGPDWNTRDDVFWGIVGTNYAGDPSNTLYATREQSEPGTPSIPWQRRSNSSQSATNSIFNAFASGYLNSELNAVAPTGVIQDTTFANSYAQFTQNAPDFGFFTSVEGSFANGTAGTTLDLFRLTSTQQAAGDVYIGTFNISDTGAVSFTGAAVPEPGTSLFFGIGAMLLGASRRRQAAPEPATLNI